MAIENLTEAPSTPPYFFFMANKFDHDVALNILLNFIEDCGLSQSLLEFLEENFPMLIEEEKGYLNLDHTNKLSDLINGLTIFLQMYGDDVRVKLNDNEFLFYEEREETPQEFEKRIIQEHESRQYQIEAIRRKAEELNMFVLPKEVDF